MQPICAGLNVLELGSGSVAGSVAGVVLADAGARTSPVFTLNTSSVELVGATICISRTWASIWASRALACAICSGLVPARSKS